MRTGGNFPTLAIDRAGNLYAVWEQAPYDRTAKHAGDTSLMYAYSTDEGSHWSAPIQIPTPGLANNVFAWAAAGDDGRVDIAWYGTAAHVDLVHGGPDGCMNGGPDSVDGSWSLYFTQTLNGHASTVDLQRAGRRERAPDPARQHPDDHRQPVRRLPNNQLATNRTLGDFFQLRIGSKGEAEIAYSDSDQPDQRRCSGSHAMYVRQIGGTGVYAGQSPKGDAILLGSTTDPSGDATYDALGATSANMPNLDITSSKLSWPSSRVLPSGRPGLPARDDEGREPEHGGAGLAGYRLDLVWLTQWQCRPRPAAPRRAPSCANGGANFMVYAESNGGGAFSAGPARAR